MHMYTCMHMYVIYIYIYVHMRVYMYKARYQCELDAEGLYHVLQLSLQKCAVGAFS